MFYFNNQKLAQHIAYQTYGQYVEQESTYNFDFKYGVIGDDVAIDQFLKLNEYDNTHYLQQELELKYNKEINDPNGNYLIFKN